MTCDITTASTQILTDQRVTGDITTVSTQILTDQGVTGDITTASTKTLINEVGRAIVMLSYIQAIIMQKDQLKFLPQNKNFSHFLL